MLVDSHCHLNFPELSSRLEEVIANAKQNGVGYMQTISTNTADFSNILTIAENYDNIWCSVGVHPNNVANEHILNSKKIIDMATHAKVIGIGETGLDYYYENSPKTLQIESFIEHIKASRETALPVIIHTRSADKETIDILQQESKKGAFPGLIHCFSASRNLAIKAMELGMYISISGIVTFRKANDLQEIVKDLPLDKLLLETDSPYLAPVPFRGKPNEPAYTRYTAEFIAQLRGVEYKTIVNATTNNFFNLFKKAKINK